MMADVQNRHELLSPVPKVFYALPSTGSFLKQRFCHFPSIFEDSISNGENGTTNLISFLYLQDQNKTYIQGSAIY